MSRRNLNFDLVSLRLWVAVCETRSLSVAAARTNMAISTASRRLHLLEQEMGATLVTRVPHGLQPTMAGLTALRYAQSMLRTGDQLTSALADHRSGVRGRVRIFASSSALLQRLPRDLGTFTRTHPDVEIDLQERPTRETLVALGRGQADLGVVLRGAGAELLQSHPYARDRLAVAVFPGHPLAEQSTVTLAEILEHDVVSLDPGTAVQRLVLEKAAAVGRTMRPRVQVRSFEALCQMVAQGLGIGILPETVLRTSANALGLKILVLDETWALRDIDICLPAETQPDAATERLLRVLLSP